MFILEKKAKGYLRNLRTVCKKISKLSHKEVAESVGPEDGASSARKEVLPGGFTYLRRRLVPSYRL